MNYLTKMGLFPVVCIYDILIYTLFISKGKSSPMLSYPPKIDSNSFTFWKFEIKENNFFILYVLYGYKKI